MVCFFAYFVDLEVMAWHQTFFFETWHGNKLVVLEVIYFFLACSVKNSRGYGRLDMDRTL
jgi:hypothetical protein